MLAPNASIPVNGVQFDYVSGSLIPFFKLKHKDPKIAADNYADFVGLMNYVKGNLKGYFSWSTLFNAFQEEKDGKFLTDNDKLGHTFSYSDSGGLQAARRNMEINNELKEKIYTVQHKYSDIAMTFDEMPFKPIEVNAGTAVVGTSSRCYIREMIKDTAEHSAEHIRKQIEMFDKLESSTKICPIIHGFRPSAKYFRGEADNTYVEYAKRMFDKIDNSTKHIHGLSIASLTTHPDNRVGILKVVDYVPRTLASRDIPDENLEHVHLLGLASPQRILPVIALVKAGLMDPRVKRISFDSTAITKAMTVGRVFKNIDEFKNPEQNRDFHPELTLRNYKDPSAKNVQHYYRQVHKYFKNYDNYPFTSWEDLADYGANNGDRRKIMEQVAEKGIEFHIKHLAHVRICSMYATWIYLETLENYIDGVLTSDDIAHYNTDIAAIYKSIEHDVTDMESLFEATEMHYRKVSAEIDHSTDTIKQYQIELERVTEIETKGHTESNILFCENGKDLAAENVQALKDYHHASTRGKTNSARTRRKAGDDKDNLNAKIYTDSLF